VCTSEEQSCHTELQLAAQQLGNMQNTDVWLAQYRQASLQDAANRRYLSAWVLLPLTRAADVADPGNELASRHAASSNGCRARKYTPHPLTPSLYVHAPMSSKGNLC
jgi:hypothetical protein